jgi:micrococcal nuclease
VVKKYRKFMTGKKKSKVVYAMSKRQKNTIFAFVIVLSVTVAFLDRSYISKIKTTPKTTEQAIIFDYEKYHEKNFTVANVVDGDTIDIDVPDGNFPHTRIRLWGVDTPETKNERTGVMYFGPEAAEFTKKAVLGKEITVYLEEHRTRGKYGRLLAYVRLPDGTYLNEALLKEGYAYADTRFRHSFYNKYKQLESAARSSKKGLWKEVKPEQMPEWRQDKFKD